MILYSILTMKHKIKPEKSQVCVSLYETHDTLTLSFSKSEIDEGCAHTNVLASSCLISTLSVTGKGISFDIEKSLAFHLA